MVSRREFTTTHWSRILLAREKDPRSLDDLARAYRAPIHNFILSRGFPSADAEDLTQETFLEVFRDGFLQRADRAKGRFRALLLAVTKHVMARARRQAAAAKRGGGRAAGPLEEEPPDPDSLGDLRDEEFDRLWALDLVRRAIDDLSKTDDREGRPGSKALKLAIFKKRGYDEIAKELGLKLHDVKNLIHRTRARLRQRIRDLVGEYSGSDPEFDDEISYLGRFLEDGK